MDKTTKIHNIPQLIKHGASLRIPLTTLHAVLSDATFQPTHNPITLQHSSGVTVQQITKDENNISSKAIQNVQQKAYSTVWNYVDANITNTTQCSVDDTNPQTITLTPQATHTSVIIDAKKNTNVSINIHFVDKKETTATHAPSPFIGVHLHIIAQDNAHVSCTISNKHTTANKETVNALLITAHAHSNAQLVITNATIPTQLCIQHTELYLEGQNAQSNYVGVYAQQGNSVCDTYVGTYHKAPHTTSDMKVRSVVTDDAYFVQRGLVHIAKNASNADGYQQTDILLINDENQKAKADAVPQLEINNNDVKCSHGATIGTIQDEQLYYLSSRGINKETASSLIVEGFLKEIVPNQTQLVDDMLAKKHKGGTDDN